MKRKTLKRITIIAVCLMMLVTTFSMPVAAANVCEQISGSSKQAKTFMVNTGSRWLAAKDVVKLTQSKGTMEYWKLIDKTNKTYKKSMYEIYTVKVEKISNGKVVKTKTYNWSGATIKLKLDKNSLYRVTVTSCWVKNKGKYSGGTLFNPYGGVGGITWMPIKWVNHSVWKVSCTRGILSCN